MAGGRKRKRNEEKQPAADDEAVKTPKAKPRKTKSAAKRTSKDKVNPKIEDKEKGDVSDRQSGSGRFWLLKSEPETRMEKGVDMKFGIEDLMKEPNQTACWDGVRNYAARNTLRDEMKMGDLGFFYHSNCKVPGIVGIVEIVKEGYPDHTQFEKSDPHYDPASKKDNPRWFMVDVKYKRRLKNLISLHELKALHQQHKATDGPLAKIALFTRARLSVQPISQGEWDFILGLEEDQKE